MNKKIVIKYLPELIFSLIILFVLLSWLAFYLIDLRNIFGLRDVLFELNHQYFFFTYRPFFFQHWGRNSGFAEIVQWILLTSSAIIFAFSAGQLYSKNKKIFYFWLIMGVAFMLMLLEDAGNLRHVFMSYIQVIARETDQGIVGTLSEFIYFSILGGIPLYALIRYWSELKNLLKTKIYLLIGFFSYGLAASLSFLGTAFEGLLEKNLYTLAGEKFYQLALKIGDSDLANRWETFDGGGWFTIDFFLMDSMIEESIELIGGGAFLAAAISYLIILKSNKNKEDIIK